uniref:Uncharacterized protein LOC110213012 n=1 Tax=Phascolarctos cinereus TaxID=38626 RepID=A0A6P5KZN8_PHACI|nr:uncharacterized protein LOC110213012 [Phascolarctos cinereus]
MSSAKEPEAKFILPPNPSYLETGSDELPLSPDRFGFFSGWLDERHRTTGWGVLLQLAGTCYTASPWEGHLQLKLPEGRFSPTSKPSHDRRPQGQVLPSSVLRKLAERPQLPVREVAALHTLILGACKARPASKSLLTTKGLFEKAVEQPDSLGLQSKSPLAPFPAPTLIPHLRLLLTYSGFLFRGEQSGEEMGALLGFRPEAELGIAEEGGWLPSAYSTRAEEVCGARDLEPGVPRHGSCVTLDKFLNILNLVFIFKTRR